MTVLCFLLTLLHACGELFMLRQTYQPPDTRPASQFVSESQLSSHGIGVGSDGESSRDVSRRQLVDLSSLYPGCSSWSPRRWNKLHQFISKAQHRQLQLCWVRDTCSGFVVLVVP